MAGENTVATLNGLFKTVYADKLLDLVPDHCLLQKKIEFTGADKETGAFYAQPVNLSHESGFTYNGTAGGVVALKAPVNGVMKEAQVYGSELILRSQMSYGALSRASKQGPKAFKRASAWKIEDMNNSMRKRLEIAMLYGQKGVGTVSSLSSQDIILSAQGWAGGIWAGAEGTVIDVFQSDLETLRRGDLTITAVNSDTRTLTVTGTTSGIVDTDVIFFDGANATAGAYNEMAGLQKIITNAGTLFNIAANTYSLWKGTSYDLNSSSLTLAKMQAALAKAVNKGLMEKVLLIVSPTTFGNLVSDQAALRVYGESSGAKLSNGGDALEFHGVSGKVEVMSHPFVKEGDAFAIPLDSVLRLGSVDLTFGVPGFDEDFFTLVSGYNAVEVQCMADQAIFVEKPAHAVYFQEILNS